MEHKPTILITGAAVRLGRELALGLARRGFSIAVHYYHHQQEAQKLIDEIRELNVECQGFCYNLLEEGTADALIEEVIQSIPGLGVVINSAAIIQKATLLTTCYEDYDSLFALNLKAPFFITQAFAKRCQQGQVINILDTYITKDKTPYFGYLITKKALAAFTQMAAYELAPGIRVNGICPGLVMSAGRQDEEFYKRKLEQLPLKSLPTPQQVVDAAFMIIESPYLTGQLISVDSGEHLL
ncbi:MAG: SDR family oxidoreductase [Alphaproteobacteria bacterium]|nr:SDR family oxidoreductase [Alphaproteobacteria bacterium]